MIEAVHLDGAALGWLWALPFAGILLSIATGPVLYPHLWEHHYGKFAAAFAARLNSRTFVSDSGLVISATDR